MREIYTDGACKGNPGPGGFGVLIKEDSIIKYKYFEEYEQTTNNSEELKAILHALDVADKCFPNEDVLIYSDSAYCVNMINDWIWTWADNDWKNSKKKEVENIDLVKQIYNYINKEFYHCQVIKIKGHHGIIENELVDAIATNNKKKYNKILTENNLKEVLLPISLEIL